MINVYILDTSLSIKGHAEKDETGVSLVCCAVSALFYFVAAAVNIMPGVGVSIDENLSSVIYPQNEKAKAIFELIKSGFLQLQANFPEEINVWIDTGYIPEKGATQDEVFN